jgi:hypothetical protein
MKSRNLAQHNVITTGRYNHTSLESNILAYLVKEATDFLFDSEINMDQDVLVNIPVKALSKWTKKDVNYSEIRKMAERIKKLTYHVKWGSIKGTDFERVFMGSENRQDDDFVYFDCIRKAEYHGHSGTLRVLVNKDMLPFFINLRSQMTIYNLNTYLVLKTSYAKRFYLFFCMFKDRGVFMKKLEDIKIMLALEDAYPQYKELKRRVIKPALDEINRSTNFVVKMEEKRNGRKIDLLVFKFHEKKGLEEKTIVTKEVEDIPNATFSLVHPEELSLEGHRPLYDRCKEVGLEDKQIEKIFTTLTYKEITHMLYQVNVNGVNKKAYAKKIFAEAV